MIAGDFTGQPAIFDPNTTQNLGGGVYKRTAFPNNQIPRSLMDPAAVKLLALFPAPTNSAAFNNYVVSPVEALQTNRFDFRHDLQISQYDNLFARYSYFTNDEDSGPFAPPLVGSTTFQNSVKSTVGNGAALGETHVFSARMVNEFRSGYNRIFDVLQPFVKDYIDSQYGLGGIPAQPGVARPAEHFDLGLSTIGEATFLPNSKVSKTLPLEDHVTLLLGNHNLKFGGSYRFVRSWYAISSSARGTYTFNGGASKTRRIVRRPGRAWPTSRWGFPAVRASATSWQATSDTITGAGSYKTIGRSRRASP